MLDLICFGSLTVDIFIQPEDFPTQKCTGKDVMAFPIGEKMPIKKSFALSGGGAANSAIGFAKMGLKIGVSGIIGDDEKAEMLKSQLLKHNIDIKGLVTAKKQATSMSLIFCTPDGRRTAFVHKAKTKEFNAQTFKDHIKQTKAVYISHLKDNADDILQEIPNWKKETEIQPKFCAWNPGKTQFKKGLLAYAKVFPHIDVLILNVEEAEMFTGKKAIQSDLDSLKPKIVGPEPWDPLKLTNGKELVQPFLDLGVKGVFLTDGRRGAQYISPKEYYWTASRDLNPKNTLGAGDAFSVGVVTAFLKQKSAKDALIWGGLNAYSTIQAFGAQRGQLSWRQLQSFLKKE